MPDFSLFHTTKHRLHRCADGVGLILYIMASQRIYNATLHEYLYHLDVSVFIGKFDGVIAKLAHLFYIMGVIG